MSGKNVTLTRGTRILGHVQDASSKAVPWVDVTIFDSASGAFKGLAQSNEDGDYILGNLVTGNYKVRFDYAGGEVVDGYYPSESGDLGWYYGRQFYSAKTTTGTANVVSLTTGVDGFGVNATLSPTANWGTIGARVTGPNGSELAGIEVGLDYSDGAGGWVGYNTETTDFSGRVKFPYVPAGTLTRIRANVDMDGAALNDRWSTASTMYTMVGGVEWTGSLSLLKPATDGMGTPLGLIWGKARDAVTSGHISAVPISTYLYDEVGEEWLWEDQMTADSAGWFEIPVPEGKYLIEGGPTAAYASEFYFNASDVSSATTITVTPPATTSLLWMPLDAAHTLSGTVVDADGAGLSGVHVSALKYNAVQDVWRPVTYDGATHAFTASDGTYTLGGLSSGTYRLMAYGWDVNLGDKGWKAIGEAQSVDQADNIVISGAASAHPGYDMTLTPAVSLRGSVTDGDAKRVAGVHVKLWWEDAIGDWNLINSTYTYGGGDFQFGQFSAGNYFLEFIDDTNFLYADSWYKSVSSQASAVSVPLLDGESKVITQTISAGDTLYSLYAGDSRIETAIRASESAFPDGARTVVIATAFNWPDALGGAALAGAHDGPILLTSPMTLPTTVLDEINRLGATDAIILGGTGAVGLPIETSLNRALGSAHVVRLAGKGRYETAALVAEATIDRLGTAYDGTAFVSTGGDFPDALGASPLSAASSWPIYLTANTSLTPATRTSMAAHGVNRAIILGGTGAVSAGVESSLDTLLGGRSRTPRLAGRTRYETAVIVAQYGVDNVYGLGWNNVAIATGQNFPDALAGGVMQGQAGSVMLLTPSLTLDPYVAAKLTAEKDTITAVSYLGGTGALSTPVRTAIQRILR